MNGGDGNTIDFHIFYHVFTDCEVSSIRECFLEWIQKTQTIYNVTDDSPFGTSTSFGLDTIKGEIIAHVSERTRWTISSGKSVGTVPSFTGSLYVTNYRLVLSTNRNLNRAKPQFQSRFDIPAFFDIISLPLNCIYRVQLTQPRNAITIISKDYRHIRITLASNEQLIMSRVEGLIQLIEGEAFHKQSVSEFMGSHIFAFKNREQYSQEGWGLCDIRKEYIRQGLFDDSRWKVGST